MWVGGPRLGWFLIMSVSESIFWQRLPILFTRGSSWRFAGIMGREAESLRLVLESPVKSGFSAPKALTGL